MVRIPEPAYFSAFRSMQKEEWANEKIYDHDEKEKEEEKNKFFI